MCNWKYVKDENPIVDGYYIFAIHSPMYVKTHIVDEGYYYDGMYCLDKEYENSYVYAWVEYPEPPYKEI